MATVMARETWRRELAWAVGLLGLAVILGFMFHWSLVQASLRGNLTALLDQKRQERDLKHLQKRAKALGFILQPLAP